MGINGELCVLGLLYSNTTFCATLVKLYFTLITQIEGIKVELTNIELIDIKLKDIKLINRLVDELTILLVKRSKRQPLQKP